MDVLKKAGNSFLTQAILTLIVYFFYAVILGLSFSPSVYITALAFKSYILQDINTSNIILVHILKFGITLGIAVFLFFITGLIIMSIFVRILSLGVKEGKYPAVSLTTLRWLIYSGIYNLAVRMILPVIPMTFFSTLFFKIIGCRIGNNVYLNTWILNDAYLMEIGDNVIIGGATDISCHIYEHGHLKLKRIKIGDGTMIGAHCYISPGVTIGKNCLIGLNTYIRQDRNIPDNTKITSLAGISFHKAHKIEKGGTV